MSAQRLHQGEGAHDAASVGWLARRLERQQVCVASSAVVSHAPKQKAAGAAKHAMTPGTWPLVHQQANCSALPLAFVIAGRQLAVRQSPHPLTPALLHRRLQPGRRHAQARCRPHHAHRHGCLARRHAPAWQLGCWDIGCRGEGEWGGRRRHFLEVVQRVRAAFAGSCRRMPQRNLWCSQPV